MAPQCCFTLPNGKKCRCAATRNQQFCRHHAPKAAAPSIPKRERLTRVRRWGTLNRMLPSIDPAEIPFEAYSIFEALLRDGPRGISDREAGRLLRGLFRRHGSVPFPLPSEEGAPPATPPALQLQRKPAPVSLEDARLQAILDKIGPDAVDNLSDADFLKAWAETAHLSRV